MNPEVLDKVLACRNLPTLPAVAMKVVELTSSRDVSMRALAETIQNDQALAAKILRTVNSSLYGLRTKCSSINQAIVMLGLSAVKTLALGFTLVSAIKDCDTGDFDLEDHWRRALFTGIAARSIAAKARLSNAEECFLGGLLQDVGMIALYQTLGRQYLDVVAKAEGDHRRLSKAELETLEIQHGDVGAMLATRWRLPETLIMPIKYHERPTAAPVEHTGLVRAVGLGNIASDVLTSPEPGVHLRKFYQRAEQWFGIDPPTADEVLKVISTATREVSSLLSVPTGQVNSAEAVLSQAREQMAKVTIPAIDESSSLSRPGGSEMASTDDLTGASSRVVFDRTMVAAFEQTRAGVGPLSVALFDVDGLDEINEQFGREAGDAVLIAVASRLDQAFKPHNALVARYDGGRFAVLMPRVDRVVAVKAAEQARTAIAAQPVTLIAAKSGAPPQLTTTASAGVASLDSRLIDRFDEPSQLQAILEQAVKAAKKAGRNNLRVYAPALAA
jgi:diguanylate cyclase (GGDEF)-like protein